MTHPTRRFNFRWTDPAGPPIRPMEFDLRAPLPWRILSGPGLIGPGKQNPCRIRPDAWVERVNVCLSRQADGADVRIGSASDPDDVGLPLLAGSISTISATEEGFDLWCEGGFGATCELFFIGTAGHDGEGSREGGRG